MTRLFVGVPPSDAARDALGRYVSGLRHVWPHAKWVPPENLHYTMLFIGRVAPQAVDDIALALDSAVRGLAPFEVSLGDAGSFPGGRQRARVLWVGAAAGESALKVAAAACAQALLTWVPAEERPFVPHLTIARFRAPEPVGELPPLEPVDPWTARGVTLYNSVVRRPAPVYEEVHRAFFAR
jgi:RNA 2',3'-cyclic 3'-phosphodiesterase